MGKTGILIGLTGGIASGKSTVAALLVERGFRLLDADGAARRVVEPGQPALAEIVEHFGAGILLPDGRLDRTKLGSIVFSDATERAKLNAITHPRIAALLLEQLAELRALGSDPVLLDHPLLYETGLQGLVDRVVVVYVDRQTQLARLMRRNSLSQSDALARIGAQMDLDEKARRADHLIDNRGPLPGTVRQVDELCKKLLGDA
jgi:dephospho-CoA kinase